MYRHFEEQIAELKARLVHMGALAEAMIEDEPDLVKLLDYNLRQADYLVLTGRNGKDGLDAARRHHPNVVILDVWEVVKRLRADPSTSAVPLLMLTAKAEEPDRVLGLELGADDYVTKPFSDRELLARVKALLRRQESAASPPEVLRSGDLVVDSGRRQVTVGRAEVHLTTTEFNLLRALAQRPGRVLTREELITLARGEDVAVVDRTVDVHVATLRRKLGPHGDRIETVRGVGYRLKE